MHVDMSTLVSKIMKRKNSKIRHTVSNAAQITLDYKSRAEPLKSGVN